MHTDDRHDGRRVAESVRCSSVGIALCLAWVMGVGGPSGAQTLANPANDAVQNVRVEPRGGGTLAIVYDLVAADPEARFTVQLRASRDEGGAFDITPRTVSGDIGANVAPGSGKTIVWQAGQDVETFQLDRLQFDVRAVRVGGDAAALGTLTVTSVPVGATVIVDGERRGVTPLTLTLPAGRHDVRLERAGFLENRRAVELGGGATETVAVTLTPTSGAAATTQTVDPAKSGGVNPLVWVALAGGGAAAAVLAAGGGGDGGGTGGGGGGGGTTPLPAPTCTFSASPSTASFPSGGGTVAVTVSASPAGCTGGSWTASAAQAVWVSLSPTSGAVAGTVNLTTQANVTQGTRSGSVTVAGTTITVSQPTSCSYSAIFPGGDGDPRDSPRTVVPGDCMGPNCGRRGIQVTTAATCEWGVAGLPSWLTIEQGLGPFAGGRNLIMYVTQANPSGSIRTGTFTVGTQTMTVEQCIARCP